MSGDFNGTKNFSLLSHKVNWLVVINCPGHFASTNPVVVSSAGANISSTEKKVLQWSCNTGEFSQELRKLETFQWEQTSAARPHMIIQTDASTKGWRHTAGFNSFKA